VIRVGVNGLVAGREQGPGLGLRTLPGAIACWTGASARAGGETESSGFGRSRTQASRTIAPTMTAT
jgi:hypothetical protein